MNIEKMVINVQDKVLTVTLPSEATIRSVEADFAKIRSSVSEYPERIELQADAVEEIDTAYLQLILSLKATANDRNIPFFISGIPPEFRKTCKLYGILKSETQRRKLASGDE